MMMIITTIIVPSQILDKSSRCKIVLKNENLSVSIYCNN